MSSTLARGSSISHSIPLEGRSPISQERRSEEDAATVTPESEWTWSGNPTLIHSFPIPPRMINSHTPFTTHSNGSTSSLTSSSRPLPTPPSGVPPYPSPGVSTFSPGLLHPPFDLKASTSTPKKKSKGSSKIPRRSSHGHPTPKGPRVEALKLELDDMDTSPFSDSFSGMFSPTDISPAGSATPGAPRYLPVGDDSMDSFTLGNQQSFIIERYTDLRAVEPIWKDEDIDEIVVIAPKQKIKKRASTLSGLNIKLPSIQEDIPGVSHLKFRSYDETFKLTDFEFLPAPAYDGPASEDVSESTKNAIHRSTKHLCSYRRKGGSLVTNRIYTVKRKTGITSVNSSFAWRELDAMSLVGDGDVPFIDRMYGTFVDADNIFLVLGHYERGNLADLVDGRLGAELVTLYTTELVLAIQGIHGKGIIHNDIRPTNIHIDEHQHLVLTGFEVACIHGENPVNVEYESNRERDYLAPEMLLGWKFDESVDVWGFGMVLGWMVTGKHIFLGDLDSDSLREAEHESKILYGRPLLDNTEDGALRDLVGKCLERNPVVRLGSQKLVEHDFFSNTLQASQIPPLQPTRLPPKRSHRQPKESLQEPIVHSPIITVKNGPSALPVVTCCDTAEPPRDRSANPAVDVATEPRSSHPPPALLPPIIIAGASSPVEAPDASPTYPSSALEIPKATIIARDSYLKEIEISATELTPQERMALFWEKIDTEEVMEQMHNPRRQYRHTRSRSTPQLRIKAKESTEEPPRRPRKLKKKSSTIKELGHRISSLSLAGQPHLEPVSPNKLRKKKSHRRCTTTPAIHDDYPMPSAPPPLPAPNDVFTPTKIQNLPHGVEQIGVGIGFTYALPSASKSKASICTDKSTPGRWKGRMKMFKPSGIGKGFSGVRKRLSMAKLNGHRDPAPDQKRRDGLEVARNSRGLGIEVDDFGGAIYGRRYDSSPEMEHELLTPDSLVFNEGPPPGPMDGRIKEDDHSFDEDLRHMSTLRLVQSPPHPDGE
ncbi:hypothetical protein ONZ45_g9654 [Pleurotus djamor]|nr:hypothetical protein ONZ45_g9654 [Pleurotus djamor]